MMGGRTIVRSCFVALLCAPAALPVACESRVSLGSTCAVPGDCPGELSCLAGRCRVECATSRDCEEGRRCLRAASGVTACSTAPDDSCRSVEDCADPTFSLCVESRCQTACVEDAECAGGDCVRGGCVERASPDSDQVGTIALGSPSRTTTVVGSVVVRAPDGFRRALVLAQDVGFSDVGVVVEDTGAAGPWSVHVATMQRLRVASERVDFGVPTRVDVELSGLLMTHSSWESMAGSDATSVAAEPMGDGRPAYYWVIGAPDPEGSDDAPGRFAMFARGAEPAMTMSTSFTTRFPAQAAIARGLGDAQDGPGWGFRVVDGASSEYQVGGPMGGAGSEAHVSLEAGNGPVDAEGSVRSFVLREQSGRVRFVRLQGPELLRAASFDLVASSSCAPGLTDRFVLAAGNYVAATCDGPVVTLHNIACPSAESRGLDPCTITSWLTLTEPVAPSGVSLETWPGGVVVVTRDDRGAHVRPLSDEATPETVASSPRYESVLPSSYRVNARLDFRLVRAASNAASREGASIVALAGLYLDEDNDLAEIRIGVFEVTAAR